MSYLQVTYTETIIEEKNFFGRKLYTLIYKPKTFTYFLSQN